MRQWFESLPSRDQIALMALVAALGLWLFVQLIFIELDGRRDRLTQGNQALAEKLMRVDLKVEQLAALRAGGGDQKINLTRTLSQASEANGLTVQRLQPNSRGEVQIRFEGVAFDNLLQWLQARNVTHNHSAQVQSEHIWSPKTKNERINEQTDK